MTVEASGNGYKFDEDAETIEPLSADETMDGLIAALSVAIDLRTLQDPKLSSPEELGIIEES